MRKKTEMLRKDFYLTKKQVEFIDKEAIEKGITFSEILRRILDNYIKQNDIRN
jgi:hypothetical protein